jgi:hypothetical protein
MLKIEKRKATSEMQPEETHSASGLLLATGNAFWHCPFQCVSGHGRFASLSLHFTTNHALLSFRGVLPSFAKRPPGSTPAFGGNDPRNTLHLQKLGKPISALALCLPYTYPENGVK